MRRITTLRIVLAAAMLVAAIVVPRSTSALMPPGEFPIGWYDALSSPGNLSTFAAQRMTAALPYDSVWGSPTKYLDAARGSGIQAMLEIPRALVRNVDVAGVRRFVSLSKAHPALLGWYLADEPSINKSVGPLSPANATKLYNAIKAVDTVHPVAMTFSSGEDPRPYLPALDVMMHDDYPAYAGRSEYQGLHRWAMTTAYESRLAQNEQGFYPVLQAFGGTNEAPVFGRRLPTAGEERYMVYTALQVGADGLFFWTYYRSDPTWVRDVLVPLVAELEPMRPALAAGPQSGLASSSRSDVGAVVFRDPSSGAHYLASIHHGFGTVDAPLTLTGALAGTTTATLLSPTQGQVAVSGGTLPQTLGPYEVKLYRIG